MTHLHSLGYLHFTATDLDAWRSYCTDVLGMAEVKGPDADALYLQMDDSHAYRLVITKGDKDGLGAAGWEAAGPAELEKVAADLRAAGHEVSEADEAAARQRRVKALVRFTDPDGNQHEAFHGMDKADAAFKSQFGVEFQTAEEGMGHIVLATNDDAGTLKFWESLGFKVRDTISLPGEMVGREPGTLVNGRFIGINPRHHSVAFMPFPTPSGIIHFMVEVKDADQVGLALDRALKAGIKMSATLGRHSNDKTFGFYMKTPGGWDVEVGAESFKVPEDFEATEGLPPSVWGHDFSIGFR